MSTLLEVNNITCRYEHDVAVQDTSFHLQEGVLACLLGPSGCGKTTVLRAIAGFQKLDAGNIKLSGITVSDKSGNTEPEKRKISMVFQDHALFPHLSIGKNIAAGLLSHDANEKREVVDFMLENFGLTRMKHRYPHELSGGQQQRIALARALAPKPKLLLMDEPFSNLDVELREKLCHEIRDLLKEIGTTCLLVTHDQQDAFAFGEQIGVMQDGTIKQWDSPYNLYHEPSTQFIADFVGEGVFLDGVVLESNEIETELAKLSGPFNENISVGTRVQVLIRPDDVIHDDNSKQSAKIKDKAFRGAHYLYTLVLPSGKEILSLVPSHHDHTIGTNLGIRTEVDHLVIFPY